MSFARLSQSNLFFPLPFTDTAIENVVEATNTQPPGSNGAERLLVFKVLSAVRHRYTVRPPVGFIAAGESVQVFITLDPESIRAQPDAAARELPTADTKDAIYIDFAQVPPDTLAAKTFMAAHASGTVAETSHELQATASNFWRQRGAFKAGDPASARKRLRCVFGDKADVPSTMTMRLSQPRRSVDAAAAPAVPATRPPPSAATDAHRTAPPESPPARSSHNSPAAADTPRGASAAPSAAAAARPAPPPPAAAAAAAATSAAPPLAPLPGKSQATGGGGGSASAGASRGGRGLLAAGKAAMAKERAKPKGTISRILNYRVNYAIALVLIVLSLLCGVYETNTFLSRRIAGR